MIALTAAACGQFEDDADDLPFALGKTDGGIDEGSPEARGVLALVNDPDLDASTLAGDAHIASRATAGIVAHRNGTDGLPRTADDDPFDTLAELDAIRYVGPATLDALIELAAARGLVIDGAAQIDAIFSPQQPASSTNARLAELIRGAQHSIDIAIYSYSDAGVIAALTDAVARGVTVRFLYEVGRDDQGITDPAARAASKSGKIEATGVDVRFVNKTLHHKVLIVDGPRADLASAATARIATGSANWSFTGSQVYDEHTLFITGSPMLAAAYQQEFDALWHGSRDFVGPAAAQPESTLQIDPAQVPAEPGIAVYFTRANMRLTGRDGASWSTNKNSLAVSDQLVAAIQRAQTSIHIASAHMRLRPVAEALIAKKRANPTLDIRVYLDQQEFVSASAQAIQNQDLATCIAEARTPAQVRDCSYDNYLFSKDLVDAGIDLRFKSYAYRWHASYAVQMHSKYTIIDGAEVLSGSYNLSMNAEHDTFENLVHVFGPEHRAVVDAFEANFATIWDTARAPARLDGLRSEIATASTIPLLFPEMALTWSEFDSLRSLIRANCRLADSADYRANPAAHKTCPR